MSMVIKASSANGSIRRFVAPSMLDGDSAPVEPDVLAELLAEPAGPVVDEEKVALLQQVAALQEDLAAAGRAAAESQARAREEGRKQGLESAREAEAGRQAILEKAVVRLADSWGERLQELDGLAAVIARSALSKLFDSWDEASEFTARTIARQIRLLRREAIVAVRVSPGDFPDEQAVARLAARAGAGSVRLVVDPDLAVGECRADLQLGHVDLGVATQRAELLRLLDSLLAEEDAP